MLVFHPKIKKLNIGDNMDQIIGYIENMQNLQSQGVPIDWAAVVNVVLTTAKQSKQSQPSKQQDGQHQPTE